MSIVWLLLISCIGGVTYRLGGTSAGTKWRDVGTSLCLLLSLIMLGVVNGLMPYLSLILVFGMTFGALSTYRYFLPRPEEGNYTGWHYALHGFMVALADAPFAWASGRWICFGVRCVICGVLVGVWSWIIKWDVLEEFGRGFILCSTRLLYLLPV